MHEQWTKNDTGIIVPFNFVPFNFVLKSSMSWHCFESKRTNMHVSEFLNAKCLVEFHFLFDMDPRDASVDLLYYQEHLLQWMTVGDLLGDLVGRIETHHGGRCGKRNICIAAEGHRQFAARESLTILRELADENSVVSLVARPSSVGKQMLAEFWLPKLDAKLAAPVLARLDLHCFQVILAWTSLCGWYNLCRVNRQWSRWLRASPTFQSVVSDARWAKDPELLSIQREVRANDE